MLGAVADGQRVNAGFPDKLNGVKGVGVAGVFRKYMVLHAGEHPQLSLYRDASLVSEADDLPRQRNIVLKGQR